LLKKLKSTRYQIKLDKDNKPLQWWAVR